MENSDGELLIYLRSSLIYDQSTREMVYQLGGDYHICGTYSDMIHSRKFILPTDYFFSEDIECFGEKHLFYPICIICMSRVVSLFIYF
jgi:hypothetical protein